jgi:hypothetical protein
MRMAGAHIVADVEPGDGSSRILRRGFDPLASHPARARITKYQLWLGLAMTSPSLGSVAYSFADVGERPELAETASS